MYRFTFTGVFTIPSGSSGAAVVFLKKDGTTIASSKEDPSSSDAHGETTMSINSITELNAGQVVYAQWKYVRGAYLNGGNERRYTHFTGELIART